MQSFIKRYTKKEHTKWADGVTYTDLQMQWGHGDAAAGEAAIERARNRGVNQINSINVLSLKTVFG